MSEEGHIIKTAPRDIIIGNDVLEYGNIEAWINIIESYNVAYPTHEVVILYEAEPVKSLFTLFKMQTSINRAGFQMQVRAPDANLKNVPKLYRLLVEGAGKGYQQYIKKEMYQTLHLF